MRLIPNLVALAWTGSARRALAIALVFAAPANATMFRLTSTDIVIEAPAPLFTSPTVQGILTLDDAILPGQSFGSNGVVGLELDFAGISGTLADIRTEIAPGPVQVFGTRSLDGRGFSVFDLRFGFSTTTAGCSFVCAGQIVINSPIGPNDPSNFIAIDDFAGDTLSVISSFTPSFALVGSAVPEPAMWVLMIAGFGAIGAKARRRRYSSFPQRRADIGSQ